MILSNNSHLQSYGIVALLVAVFHLLLLAFLESPEVVLDQEGCVELADRHLIVH